MDYSSKDDGQSIPAKANRLLAFIFIILCFITIRLWHLSFIQHDERLDKAKRPQKKVVIERAERASIRDRFNLPLALNQVQYNAAVCYAPIKEIPAIGWKTDEKGIRVKFYKRREYIEALSKLLGKELSIDPGRVEDLIYSKAALAPNIPFVIKEEISEKEYFRLKMLEKDWIGIHAERAPKRHYPCGKVACDTIGYIGKISRREYDKIVLEIQALTRYLEEYDAGGDPPLPSGISHHAEVKPRLKELEERAYTINDDIGKSGVEAMFDESLRGFRGKKSYYSDAKGNFLRELPGSRDSLPGKRVLLSLSSELQAFAEQLLIENESIREDRCFYKDPLTNGLVKAKSPWIKGGAIIAMDPNNGEILALASYPRFNPNDYIPSSDPETVKEKHSQIWRWLESEAHLAELWDQKQPLKRERYSPIKKELFEEAKELHWDDFINFILPSDHPVSLVFSNLSIQAALKLQLCIERLLEHAEEEDATGVINALYNLPDHEIYRDILPYQRRVKLDKFLEEYSEEISTIKRSLEPYFETLLNNYDKLLFVDLCRLAVSSDRFAPKLLPYVGSQTVQFYRDANSAFVQIRDQLHSIVKNLFKEIDFSLWRKNEQKEFLRLKRQEEIKQGTYQHPYLDYIDREEKLQFNNFWQNYRWQLLEAVATGDPTTIVEHYPELHPYIQKLLPTNDSPEANIINPKRWKESLLFLQDALKNVPNEFVLPYLQSFRSYEELNRPLLSYYPGLRKEDGKQLEKHLAASFYPLSGFGYSRSNAFRQATQQGSIFKIITAYTALAQACRNKGGIDQNYSAEDLNPLTIIDHLHQQTQTKPDQQNKWNVGFTLSGKPIPQMYKGGRLPRSHAAGIGKIDLIGAIEATSNPYFSLLAAEIIEKPEDLIESAHLFSFGQRTGIELPGEIEGFIPDDVTFDRTGLYALAIGQHSLVVTPLQTAVMFSTLVNGGKVLKPKILFLKAGQESVQENEQIFNRRHFAYQESLATLGIDFPLFTAAEKEKKQSSVAKTPEEIHHEVYYPNSIKNILLHALHKVIIGEHGTANANRIHSFGRRSIAMKDYASLQDYLVGKTSTAEMVERLDMSLQGTKIVTHVWFAAASFENTLEETNSDRFEKPELVVIVYLRFGDYGKEAAPLAAQIVKKWREIKAKHAS